MATPFSLSDEQNNFVSMALTGKNVLVDACIGSGKTTAIQELCNMLPSSKKILYLTYNKLLKVDAKQKIKKKNVTVTNYHGFAYGVLKRMGIFVSVTDMIQKFISVCPDVSGYDVIIIDEYQDIDLELSQLLEIVKNCNPGIQIVVVGDMEQKIYDKTSLDVQPFIHGFLEDYEQLYFTRCFRLSSELAAKLGRVWKKKIIGVNDNCVVETMGLEEVTEFLSECNPSDVLCLGSRSGDMTKVLNMLEENDSDRFNKNTVYASISDTDSSAIEPRSDSAIFTTYDSSKGLERKVCVVFDFTESYWAVRIKNSMQDYKILRNIFCVAASRGKERVIFVNSGEAMLSENTLSTPTETNMKFNDMAISSMFDFKFKESVEECYKLLNIEKIETESNEIIDIQSQDGLIDLAPCIGIYQEASYFENYDIDADIKLRLLLHPHLRHLYTDEIQNSSWESKVLFLTSLETSQNRYRKQVNIPFVTDEQKEQLEQRLSERFTPEDEVQKECEIRFSNGDVGFRARGFSDVVKDNVVYELKFVSEVKHEHFLQCACYMAALDLPQGVLWNTRDNGTYKITIPDKKRFLDKVVETITKGVISNYEPYDKRLDDSFDDISEIDEMNLGEERIAVIDTETNWNDEVMSIGVVISNSDNFKAIDEKYFVFAPEYKSGGMYSYALFITDIPQPDITDRVTAIGKIRKWLKEKGVTSIFAYNAKFDKNHLPELDDFEWYDIMRLAAYVQHNPKITDREDCCGTGRLKSGYNVEDMYRRLTGKKNYSEKHNALTDARDELEIMACLGHPLDYYVHAYIGDSKSKLEKANATSKATKNAKSAKGGVHSPFVEPFMYSHYKHLEDSTPTDERKKATEISLEKHFKVYGCDYRGIPIEDLVLPVGVELRIKKNNIDTVDKLLIMSLAEIDVMEGMNKGDSAIVLLSVGKYLGKMPKQEPFVSPLQMEMLEYKGTHFSEKGEITMDGQSEEAKLTVTSAEASRLLGVSKSTVYNMLDRGVIEGFKVGNRYCIYLESVEAYLDEQERLNRREKILTGVAIIAGIFFLLLVYTIVTSR